MTGFSTQPDNQAALERFAALLPEALEESKDPAAQKAAWEALQVCGLPHRKIEDWKYTDISAAVAGPFTRPHAGAFGLLIPDAVRLAMLGRLPAVGKTHPFALLSCALSHGGIELTVPDGLVVEEPVEVDLPSARANGLLCPALVIRAGKGSRADFLVRSDRQGEGSLISWIARIEAAEEASISFTTIRTGSGANFGHLQTRQAAGSRLSLFDASAGGALTRRDLHAVLAGEGAELELNGLYTLCGHGHTDHHTTVEHAVPNTRSRQLYKGLLGGHACGVFNGRIVVNPGARGTDAYQMNRNLLRSRTAKVNTKPQLEISNDDVRCSHGAAIGRLDEDPVFYLESRGLNRAEAEALLARGFAGEVIDRVLNPAVRETLHRLAEEFFNRNGEGSEA